MQERVGGGARLYGKRAESKGQIEAEFSCGTEDTATFQKGKDEEKPHADTRRARTLSHRALTLLSEI